MSIFQTDLQQVTVLGDTPTVSHKCPSADGWTSFEQMLQRLHNEGIYIHADQLAEFLLFHGLPVHLRYVPVHLRQKAERINQNYRGDMAQLVEEQDNPY
ncbi:hypothetical protein H6G89_13200 [Oscillatoria sp. FACHB-1407]|uniref:hypothetical protein n=1 Tax=Oscillatoria sp. FACHB-1407 TaxID=2692847 RepID=UPI0016861051|nr:hypothetical protein [Oscillatoria sp. FACHB-1407]MBD2462005.1 hypothetical protein [Oscillatoria sp. FACHB-1407]